MAKKKKAAPKKTFKEHYLPVIYLVVGLLALRFSVVEPYVVPTGSMEPTLKKGDRLYALKCAYDVRIPFLDIILFRTGKVERGDVILFTPPHAPSLTYVKRAVGLPGDRIQYRLGQLSINGKPVPRQVNSDREILYDIKEAPESTLYVENIDGVRHHMLMLDLPQEVRAADESDPRRWGYMDVVVPEGKIFAMGDNRDHSFDSRGWGFVDMDRLKGEAMFIWYSSPVVERGSWIWKMIAGWWGPRTERVGTIIQ